MKVIRIKHIKKTGILEDFNWSNLRVPIGSQKNLDFKSVNLIFGWNGTGKTTLSRVLRNFELGAICGKLGKYTESECAIDMEGGTCLTLADLTEQRNIRVFNRDFVNENIFKSDGAEDGENVKPIYYLGEERIELTKERKEREESQLELEKILTETDTKKKRLDKYATGVAKHIRDALLGLKEFQNYDKGHFIKGLARLNKQIEDNTLSLETLKLSEVDFEKKLKTVKNTQQLREWASGIKAAAESISDEYLGEINALLGKVVSLQNTIERLKEDWELSGWVQEGIKIHKQRKSTHCEFCAQTLPLGRLSDLENHFNKDYIGLSKAVSSKLMDINNLKITDLDKIPTEDVRKVASQLNSVLVKLASELEKKEKNLLSAAEISRVDRDAYVKETSRIKTTIDNILISISDSGSNLESSLIAENYEEYQTRAKELKDEETKIPLLRSKLASLRKTIENAERSIRDFRLPAAKINADLRQFLGHSELRLEDKEDSYGTAYYEIKRIDKIASNLSEGEKTAISLIYFIRKLNESDFSFKDGIVYIDDPISSLDSQFLYSAYAFIVGAIEDESNADIKIGQFFLSTHNYDFFNLFKRKYHNGNRCGLYMLKVHLNDSGGRVANIYELDHLLKKFDSDYQYLYSQMIEFEEADKTGRDSLSTIYPYPNIARRTLETFLSFKFPSKTDYRQKIAATKASMEIQESVYRFTNIQSHGTIREAQGFAPEIIEPTGRDHVLDVLKLMRDVDLPHCEEMQNSIKHIPA